MVGNWVKRLGGKSSHCLQGTARQQMYRKPSSCATSERVKYTENILSPAPPMRTQTSATHLTNSYSVCNCKCHGVAKCVLPVGWGEVWKQARDLTLNCTTEAHTSCPQLQAKTATTAVCSPDTKVLLTSLTSFPRLSLKTSTVSDRSHKEEFKESCLYKKREKETSSHCKAQTKKYNSCKYSC